MPFFLLKGLSFLPFGGLLKNPKVIIGAIIIAVLVFGYFKWKSSIKEAIFNQIYTEQAEQHIANQKEEMERRQQLMNESNRAVNKIQAERAQLLREIESARVATRNVDPARNGEVAPVLADVLEFIRNRQGVPTLPPEPKRSKVDELVSDGKEVASKAMEATEAAVDKVSTSGNKTIDAWRAKQRTK